MAGQSGIFADADFERVKQAVLAAESGTSAEIVPVVARCSGRYDRPEDMVGLWFAGLAMIAVWMVFPLQDVQAGDWGSPAQTWQLVSMLAGAFVGFLAGAVCAGRVDWLRRLFTSQTQMREEVYGRARELFFDKRVHHTGEGAGILLYVSLYERMAAVIADQNVLNRLGQQRIDEICREFTQRLHDGSPIDALCDTTDSLGTQLAPLLPRAENDVNELEDALVVIN